MNLAKTYLPKIHVKSPQHIKIGSNNSLQNGIRLDYSDYGFSDKKYPIEIGDANFIGYDCNFDITCGISLGNNCMIAAGCRFIDHDHGTERNQLMKLQKGTFSKIIINSDCWLGCNVVILKGVEIGEGAVVAAGAVVTKSIPPYEIWGGVPAKKIGERK